MSAFQPGPTDPEGDPGPREPHPEAEERALGRLDYALHHLRTGAHGATAPRLGEDAAPPRRQASESPESRLTPERARTVLALAIGSAHLSTGSLEAAEREFRDALLSDPDNDDAKSQLARTLTLLELRAQGESGNS